MTIQQLFDQAKAQATLVREEKARAEKLRLEAETVRRKGVDAGDRSRATRKALIDTIILLLTTSKKEGKPIALLSLIKLLDPSPNGVAAHQRYLYKAVVREMRRRETTDPPNKTTA